MNLSKTECKVLYVDDEKQNLDGLRFSFRKKYTIYTATTAREGFEILKKENIQVVISDQRMPDINGIDFLRKISQLYPDVIRIILTAYADLDVSLAAINEAKVFRFLTKPWNKEELDITLQQAFETFFLRKENKELMHKLQRTNQNLNDTNQTLTKEIETRKTAENELLNHKDNLEELVKARTEEINKMNEKLLTSNEELLTTNEELYQKNDQLTDEVKERQRIQEELAVSENKLRSFIDQSSEGIIIINENGEIIELNNALCQILEIERENFIHKNVLSLNLIIPEYYKNNNKKGKPDLKSILENIRKKKKITQELSITTKSGTKRFIRTSTFPICTKNEIYFGRIVTDITQLKDLTNQLEEYNYHLEDIVKERTKDLAVSEKRIRSLSNSIPGGILFRLKYYNDTFSFNYVSAMLEKITHISAKSYMQDITILTRMLFPEDREKLRNLFLDSFNSFSTIDTELRFCPDKNTQKWFHLRAKPMKIPEEKENTIFWDGIMLDITSRKLSELELKHKNEELIEAEEELRTINEELRTLNDEMAERNLKLNHAYKKIQESEESYRSLFNQAIDGILVGVQGGTVVDANTSFLKRYGYSKSEIVDHNINKIFSKETLDQKPLRYDLVKKGSTVVIERNIRHKNGEEIPVEMSTRKMQDGRMIAFIKDITERKKAEAALRESEEKFRLLFENANDAIFLMKEDIFVECNEKTLAIFNSTKEDIIGHSPDEFSPKVQPDGRLSSEKALEYIKRSLHEPIKPFDWLHKRKSGELFHAEVSLTKIKYGSDVFIQAIVRDVTERKFSEEKLKESERNYREIFNASSEGIVIHDAKDGKILDVNQTALRMYETDYESMINYSIEDLTAHDQLNEDPFEKLQKTLTEGQQIFEWHAKKESGELFWIEVGLKKASINNKSIILAVIRDISERKTAEEKIRQSEEKFRTIFENSPLGIFRADINNKFIEVNPALASMVGFENPDECLMNIHDIAQDIFVERNQYDEIKKKILKSGGLTETESILRKKDGSVFIGNLVVKPIFDEKGQPNFYEGIIEDITEKKKYQEEIIRTNNLLEGIINTSPDMVSIIDLENKRFSYISPRCKDILYYDRTDLMLENNPFKTLIFEEDMPSMHKHRDKFLKLGNNDTLSTDVRFVRKDGQIIWVNVKDQVYERNDEGTPIKSVNIITEITARKLAEEQLKKSERKFRDIFNNSIDGIAILNKSFRFLDINKSFINHTGYSREKILNENLKNLIFPEGFERLAGSFDDNGNVLINTVEVELMASEGSFPAEISSRNIIYNDEKCIISIIRDITERKHFEREMLDTIIQTEEKERERFARNLHDDLGPLLSSIKMYMNSFEGTDDHTKQRFIIDQVNDILKESIQTTKIISNDLSPHILTNYGLISAVESFIEKLNPHLSIQFSDNINDRRFHNSLETTFYRIIKELVNNTIKHANAQNVYINLLHQESELILTYSDDGVGFDLKTIEKNEKRGMGLFNLISRIKSLNGKFIMKDVKQGVLFEIIAPTID